MKNGTPIQIQLQTEVFQNDDKQEHFFDVPGQLVKNGNDFVFKICRA